MVKKIDKEIILASNSPRRKAFFEHFDFPFTIKTFDVEEKYPKKLKGVSIARYIAGLKSKPFKKIIEENQIIISALSGKTHKVITAVGFLTYENYYCIDVTTEVTFNELNEKLIDNYIIKHNPYDKAGSYAIQESIGILGISKIKGSYTNVVGLPAPEVLTEIQRLI